MTAFVLIASAWASSVYPAEVQNLAGMPCQPTCVLCHETNGGGSGTVTRAFGMAMMDRGLTGGADLDLLGTAFDALVADGVDSDGDGTPDADELAVGADPNPDAAAFCDASGGGAVEQPSYGCFNSAASPASTLGVVGGLLAVAAVARRRP